jgi:GMP synthase PP-ATPase subunit
MLRRVAAAGAVIEVAEPPAANRIINEVQGINRATCDVTSKPPGTVERA